MPNPKPTPKNTPTRTCPVTAAIAIAAAARAAHNANNRVGWKATDGNTSGASGAGVVTRSLAIASASKQL